MTTLEMIAQYFQEHAVSYERTKSTPERINVCHGFFCHWIELDNNTIKVGALGFPNPMHTIPLEDPTSIEQTLKWIQNRAYS